VVWRIFWNCGGRKRLYGWEDKVRPLQRKEKKKVLEDKKTFVFLIPEDCKRKLTGHFLKML